MKKLNLIKIAYLLYYSFFVSAGTQAKAFKCTCTASNPLALAKGLTGEVKRMKQKTTKTLKVGCILLVIFSCSVLSHYYLSQFEPGR